MEFLRRYKLLSWLETVQPLSPELCPKNTTEHVQNTVFLSSCSFPEQAQVDISPKPAEGSPKEN